MPCRACGLWGFLKFATLCLAGLVACGVLCLVKFACRLSCKGFLRLTTFTTLCLAKVVSCKAFSKICACLVLVKFTCFLLCGVLVKFLLATLLCGVLPCKAFYAWQNLLLCLAELKTTKSAVIASKFCKNLLAIHDKIQANFTTKFQAKP